MNNKRRSGINTTSSSQPLLPLYAPVGDTTQNWHAPLPKRIFYSFYLPFWFCFGLSFGYSAILVYIFDDDKGLRKYYGTEILILGGFAIITVSVLGIKQQLRRNRNMREMISLCSTIITLFIENVKIRGENAGKVIVYTTTRSKRVEFRPADVVEQILCILLTAVCSIYWQLSSLSTRFGNNALSDIEQGWSIMKNLIGLPIYGYGESDWNRMKTKELQSIVILRMLIHEIEIAKHANVIFFDDDNVAPVIDNIGKLMKKINRAQNHEESEVTMTSLYIFKFFGVLYLAGAPWVILPGYGQLTLVIYPVVFFTVGFFFALRWYIGDIFLDATDLHAGMLYADIHRLGLRVDDDFDNLFGRSPFREAHFRGKSPTHLHFSSTTANTIQDG